MSRPQLAEGEFKFGHPAGVARDAGSTGNRDWPTQPADADERAIPKRARDEASFDKASVRVLQGL